MLEGPNQESRCNTLYPEQKSNTPSIIYKKKKKKNPTFFLLIHLDYRDLIKKKTNHRITASLQEKIFLQSPCKQLFRSQHRHWKRNFWFLGHSERLILTLIGEACHGSDSPAAKSMLKYFQEQFLQNKRNTTFHQSYSGIITLSENVQITVLVILTHNIMLFFSTEGFLSGDQCKYPAKSNNMQVTLKK